MSTVGTTGATNAPPNQSGDSDGSKADDQVNNFKQVADEVAQKANILREAQMMAGVQVSAAKATPNSGG